MRFFPRKKWYKNSSRNYDDPAYAKWRKDVFLRDKHKCQYPGCECKRGLQAHHILTWAKYPGLRFNIQNGITLCKKHHNMIKGREEDFVEMFHRILVEKMNE
jgi:5-methylcytosine-specific restriction endonuclease McrA